MNPDDDPVGIERLHGRRLGNHQRGLGPADTAEIGWGREVEGRRRRAAAAT